MPILHRNGASSRQRWTPIWSVKSVRGERIVPVTDFLEGIMSTSLAEDEFLAEARLPLLPDDTKFGFCDSAAVPAILQCRQRSLPIVLLMA